MSQFRANGYTSQSTGERISKHAAEQFEDPTARIIERLTLHHCEPRPRGNMFMAFCPVHAQRGPNDKPNLQVAVGNDGDCVVHCFAHGCHRATIMEAIGYQEFHLFRPRYEHQNGQANGHTNGRMHGKPKPDRTHVYQDQHGDVVYCSKRRNGRWFQERYDVALGMFVGGDGCMKGVTLVPYMLPELIRKLQDDPKAIVCIAEGEKDVENLWGFDWAATCNVGGAIAKGTKWKDEYVEWFQGRNVVVFQDNDEPGRNQAQEVARSCRKAGCKVRVVGMPEPHKDVSDFIAAGGTRENLVKLITATPLWTPSVEPETIPVEAETKPAPKYKIRTFADVAKSIGEMVHFWENWLICGNLNMLFSLPKVGKSRFYLALAKMAWFGAPWPDGAPNPWPPGRKTIIVPYDNNQGEIYKELKRWGVPDEAAICPSDPADKDGITILDLQSPLMTEVLTDICEQEPDVKFIVVDTLTYASAKNLCKPEDVKALLDPIMRLSAKYKLCPLVLVHESSGGKAYGLRVGERARIHLRMERYDENDWKKVRLCVSESNFAERPALTMFHEEGGVRFGRDEGPVVKPGEKRGNPGTKSRDFGTWIKKQLEGGPVRVMELVNLSRMDGFMKEPTDEDPEPSISPLYNAMRMLNRQGTNIEEFKEPRERGKPLTWWRLVDYDVAQKPHQEDGAEEQPYAPY